MPADFWEIMTRDQRIEYIRTEAADKRSSGYIAWRAGVTRNVIIGLGKRAKPKVTFLGNSGRVHGRKAGTPARLPKAPNARRVPPVHANAALLAEPEPEIVEAVEPLEALTTLIKVGKHECHYPMFTDAMLRNTLEPSSLPYCGQHVEGDGEYCEAHRRVMYSTPLPKPLNSLVKPHGWNRNTR